MNLDTPIEKVGGVGKVYAQRLSKLNIFTIFDLLYHLPFRYEDFSQIRNIRQVHPGDTATITAFVEEVKNEYTKNHKIIQKAIVSDQSGKMEIIWFNQPFLAKTIKVGEKYNFSGKVEFFGRKLAMISPDYEINNNGETIHTGRIIPIYPETYGVSSKWLRARIFQILNSPLSSIEEFLPEKTIKENELSDLAWSLKNIHFPKDFKNLRLAKDRLAFDELFLLQLKGLKRKRDWQEKILSQKFKIDREKISKFTKNLPFYLTNAQNRVISEILADLEKDKPMNRLLEGDVGSGKTVVAACAIYASFLNGYQSVLMAPTEILANQHFRTLTDLLEPLGLKISLLTGNSKLSINHQSSVINLYVGTHSLIQDRVEYSKLGLAIIDEQHRFGVKQRGILSNKGEAPHVLSMTATPIPRTIALTLFGDLDLSVIDEMPKDRKKIKTWVIPPHKRDDAYGWIKKRVKDTTERAFIVCPFISPSSKLNRFHSKNIDEVGFQDSAASSEALESFGQRKLIEESESMITVKAATAEFENLKKKIFPDLRLGLLHGRQKPKEKDEVIEQFRRGALDILVSTPVVEVGIDIPEATIMMIEAADHFGLAQLHQLRGRVGRGKDESYCLLFSETTSEKVLKRIKAMETNHLGMELAEIDLQLRGPGEIYGTSQHGFPDLKAAAFTDFELIEKTKVAAKEIIPTINKYPKLLERIAEKEEVIQPN